MYGVWSAAVYNPEWLIATYAIGSTTATYPYSGSNNPLAYFDTTTAEVYEGLNTVMRRGFDQASYRAWVTAIAFADVYQMLGGGDPHLVTQTQTIAKAILLEDYYDPDFPVWLHAGLDALSMIPVVDVIADAMNAVFYWIEGDTLNAGISAAAVFIPGVVDGIVKAGKWAKYLTKVGHGIGIPPSRPWTIPSKVDYDQFIQPLPTRPAKYGKPGALEYQHRISGTLEYKIPVHEGSIWADGLRFDPAYGGVVVEAKFVEKPGASFYEGTSKTPPALLDDMWRGFDREIKRYGSAISDPGNPLVFLEVTTSTLDAQNNIAQRIVMLKHQLDMSFPFTVLLIP
jgi:hypothetical protein